MIKILKYITLSLLFLCAFFLSYFIFDDYKKYDLLESDEISMSNFYENPLSSLDEAYVKVKNKVIPYIVKATVNINGSKKIGEVIEDEKNGERYCISINDEVKWYDKYYVTILNNEVISYTDLSDLEIEIFVNNSSFESKTNYFIWVDLLRNETYILENKNNYFFLIKRLACASGANITPTKRGLFEISNKGTHFYSRDNTYICYNYLQYSGSYLLHSFPYSLNKVVLDNRLNDRVSNGCVRFSFEDSKYLYDLIPLNTTIWLN